MEPRGTNFIPDEPTHDPEVHQWFQGIEPPPARPVLPYLPGKVRARILHEHRRVRFGTWMRQLRYAVWGVALAACLVLSLGVNVWLGLGRPTKNPYTVAEEERTSTVYRFQAQFPADASLQAAVASRKVTDPEWIGRGFASGQDLRVMSFRIGTLYADALAALHSRAVDVAKVPIRHLAETLHRIQAPTLLSAYVQEMTDWLQHSTYTEAELTELLALFEPLYVSVYSQQNHHQVVTIFQLAAWLENMALALSMSDHVVSQEPAIFDVYDDALNRFQAPSQVIDAFGTVRKLGVQETLSPSERQQFQSAIQTIQHLMGDISG